MAEQKQKLTKASNSKLPQLSELPDEDAQARAKRLLREASKLKMEISEREERVTAIRDELAAICEGYSLPGFKYGLAGFEYHGYTTRRTLSKEKLAVHVAADIIDKCYDESKPFLSSKFVVFDLA